MTPSRRAFAFERVQPAFALAAAGGRRSRSIVLATHLHFDHARGFVARAAWSGALPARAMRDPRGEFDDAMRNRRTKGSCPRGYAPLADAGVLQLVDDDATIMPGVRVRRTGGHTMHHQMVIIESGGKTAVFTADLLPTVAHLPDVWVMGYDLYPLDSMNFKREFLREAVAREHLIVFEHDPNIAAGYIREKDGKEICGAGGVKNRLRAQAQGARRSPKPEARRLFVGPDRCHRRQRTLRHGGVDGPPETVENAIPGDPSGRISIGTLEGARGVLRHGAGQRSAV
jgi:glyoxylase-like metal-dependent hydrolase (beta-lactamase superfamily II)